MVDPMRGGEGRGGKGREGRGGKGGEGREVHFSCRVVVLSPRKSASLVSWIIHVRMCMY